MTEKCKYILSVIFKELIKCFWARFSHHHNHYSRVSNILRFYMCCQLWKHTLLMAWQRTSLPLWKPTSIDPRNFTKYFEPRLSVKMQKQKLSSVNILCPWLPEAISALVAVTSAVFRWLGLFLSKFIITLFYVCMYVCMTVCKTLFRLTSSRYVAALTCTSIRYSDKTRRRNPVIRTYTSTHTSTHTHTNMQTNLHTYKHIHSHTSTHTHTNMQTNLHTYKHIYAHRHTSAHTHIYMNTYTLK